MKYILAIACTLLMLSSCSTLNSVIKAKEEGKGTAVVYDVTHDQAWQLAKKSFRWGGADAIEEYKEEGYMLTSKGMNWVSSGTVMGAWIEETGSNQYVVTVITKRRISTELATGLTEAKFHKYFAAGATILKSGNKLPLSAPELD